MIDLASAFYSLVRHSVGGTDIKDNRDSRGASVGGKVGAIVGGAVGCEASGEAVVDADGPLVVGLVVCDTMWWGEAVGCDTVGEAVRDADGSRVAGKANVGAKVGGAIVVGSSMDRRQMTDNGAPAYSRSPFAL